jgi:hypothetical protein
LALLALIFDIDTNFLFITKSRSKPVLAGQPQIENCGILIKVKISNKN